ncbi:selenocysteine-specific translation elongation factor [Thermodesulfobacteriota bacterium]
MKRIILGTAGHIDHGKTELIRSLTGIETDRLKEEKERGISIELGFAFLNLDEDVRIGIVDVPGHERFVRQMVAGSGGIDLAALVVALDEGVMPQTVEHLDILTLLGVQRGLVALTKLDLVDEELAMLAEEDASDLVKGTFLESAPMVKVSAKTGEGLDELKRVLRSLALEVQDKPVHGLLRLPVDRVFTMKGHGTVVTGTLISGTLSTGDEVEILPTKKTSSVRALQSHKSQMNQAFPGERVAVNLRGLESSDIRRGDVITHRDDFSPSHMVDVKLTLLEGCPAPLKNRQKVRLHHFTTEAEARVVFADREALEPGEETMAQLRTTSPVVPSSGDRFVIRALSPAVTLGGGRILNPIGVKLRARTAESFQELDQEDPEDIVAGLIKSSGLAGCKRNELIGLSGLPAKRLDKMLDGLKSSQTVVRVDPAEDRLVHGHYIELSKVKVLDRLTAFHLDHPLKEGIPKQELRSTVPGGDKLFRRIMELLVNAGKIINQGQTIRLSTHEVRLKDDEKTLKNSLLQSIESGGNAPPTLKELISQTGGEPKQIRSLLSILTKESKIVRIKEELYFSSGFVAKIKEELARFIEKEGGITPSQFHEITRSSRKFNIPLLEYFDRERFTMRVGDQRVLRGSASSGGGGSLS